MTKIKLCGLTRMCDIDAVNELLPEYIGFVFAAKSKRYVSPQDAKKLKERLNKEISAVGVFVNEAPEKIAELLNGGVIDIAQLHGSEDEEYIAKLKRITDKPIIKAFRMDIEQDIAAVENCKADFILLDSGSGGTGTSFDWSAIQSVARPYFLAGGLYPENVGDAVKRLNPYAVDVSSGIETDGYKDINKMRKFVSAVRRKENIV